MDGNSPLPGLAEAFPSLEECRRKLRRGGEPLWDASPERLIRAIVQSGREKGVPQDVLQAFQWALEVEAGLREPPQAPKPRGPYRKAEPADPEPSEFMEEHEVEQDPATGNRTEHTTESP